jgi:glucose/arabinose dehydrogenase
VACAGPVRLQRGGHPLAQPTAEPSPPPVTTPDTEASHEEIEVEPVQAAGSASLATEVVAHGLAFPVKLAVAPDGRIFFNEREGRLRTISPEGVLQEEPVAVFATEARGEWGLIGLALDPAFMENGWIYVLYTEPVSEVQARPKIVRLTYRDGRADTRKTIYELPPTNPPDNIHISGNIGFGPDAMLYVSVGDYFVAELAQDPTYPMGGIVRIKPDGGVPEDNPFIRSDADPRIWAWGLRNTFDFAWDAAGRLWGAENGFYGCDELNLLRPGGNYGWPRSIENSCETSLGIQAFANLYLEGEDPLWNTIAPTGIVAYSGAQQPEWAGDLLVCAFNGGDIRRLTLDDAALSVASEEILGIGPRCLLDIVEAPGGSLYFSDLDAIYRLTFAP